ncbi:MAG TPA: lytic transglycosylase domain-containing protein [Gemmatimonadaceae bacterium]|nr:lytic transglycosylase domain-containing protein [Gemmatimonadaceae bacterium]
MYQLPDGRFRKYLLRFIHAVSLVALLAGGTIWTIQQQHPKYTSPVALLKLPAAVISATTPSEQAFKIGQVLRRYTANGENADRIAEALVKEGNRKNIDPSLLVGVMLIEDETLNPRARSFVGARGLMQVMPFHRGQWGCESKDLYSIEGNICHGVSVLADAIKKAPTLNVALQRYNGCVRGTNTPNCHTYSSKVLRARNRTAQQILSVSNTSPQE